MIRSVHWGRFCWTVWPVEASLAAPVECVFVSLTITGWPRIHAPHDPHVLLAGDRFGLTNRAVDASVK
jgi:hypothetical protein